MVKGLELIIVVLSVAAIDVHSARKPQNNHSFLSLKQFLGGGNDHVK